MRDYNTDQERRLQWLVYEFKYAHKAGTSDAWANVRRACYAASQVLLWHDQTPEANDDRIFYELAGNIAHLNSMDAALGRFSVEKEAA